MAWIRRRERSDPSVPDGPAEPPPRPLTEMSTEQMREWARADPERARRYRREQERLLRRGRPHQPAAWQAFQGAFLLVVVGAVGYGFLRRRGLLEDYRDTELLVMAGALIVLWLLLWQAIAARRRRDERTPY